MSNNPEVSIIIINYNSSHYTQQCVLSIIEHTTNNNYEIIIIDNNSNKDDFSQLISLKEQSFITIFRSEINVGFSGGNMLGVQYANQNSKYYFFLNNDCKVLTDVVLALSSFMENNLQAGVVTGQMYNSDQKMQPSFGYYPSVGNLLLGRQFMYFFNKELYLSSRIAYTKPEIIPHVTGSAMFVRVVYFKQIGGFDENYFLYCEEEDLCLRLRKAGWKAYLIPEAKFIHFGGGSTSKDITILKEFYISFFYFLSKFYFFPAKQILKLIYFIKMIKRVIKKRVPSEMISFFLKGAPQKDSLRYKQ